MKFFLIFPLLGWFMTVRLLAASESAAATKADVAALQGEWSMVSSIADGYVVPDVMAKTAKRICEGDITTTTMSGRMLMKARFTLDPTKTPKAIDYDMLDGTTKGQKHLGIYVIEGDVVKFCFGEPGAARPTEFTSKSGDRQLATVWKKIIVAGSEVKKKS